MSCTGDLYKSVMSFPSPKYPNFGAGSTWGNSTGQKVSGLKWIQMHEVRPFITEMSWK